MQVVMKVIEGPEAEARQRQVQLSRLPVLGEYIRNGEEWYQVKRVAHFSGDRELAGEVYAVPIVDPARDPLTLYEWLEPAP